VGFFRAAHRRREVAFNECREVRKVLRVGGLAVGESPQGRVGRSTVLGTHLQVRDGK
jgi:hypothetical protein